jgi:cysteine-rich repeat protein
MADLDLSRSHIHTRGARFAHASRMRPKPTSISSHLVIALAALIGCDDTSAITTCDGGWVCPSQLACGTSEVRCVPPEWLATCEGQPELEPCATADIPDGSCQGGLCTPIVCGNGVHEPGEVCDDGDNVSANGCRGDCLSAEQCGDGIVDGYVGEGCDDGNALSHDGCDSACTIEVATWSHLVQQPSPPPTGLSTYDTLRRRLVAFAAGVTYEWDGAAWLRFAPVEAPSNRQFSPMVYDVARHQTILYGGHMNGSPLDDFWRWDGRQWTRDHGGLTPGPRQMHAMAYDVERDRVVLFGGSDGASDQEDTWEWDGHTWEQVASALPGAGPHATTLASATYDPVRGVVVMYTTDGKTWTWNGSAWTLVHTADQGPTPGPRSAASFVFVPGLDGALLLGGSSDQVWRWDGAIWSLESTLPSGYLAQTSFYDGALGAIVTVGAAASERVMFAASIGTSLGAWTSVTPAMPLSVRVGTGLVYDTARACAVMFGGFGSTLGIQYYDETWELGSSWQRVAVGGPPKQTVPNMAYDERRGVTVIVDHDVHEWNGTTWTRIAAVEGAWPAWRSDAAVAFDRARGRVVMVGGAPLGAGDSDEMWAWDGATWQPIVGAVTPPARSSRRLAYDVARDVLVLFGGDDAAVWEWDGSWTRHEPAIRPDLRTGFAMTYDAALGEVIVTGGARVNSGHALNDTWLWNGTRWARVVATGPNKGTGATMTYMPALMGSVLVDQDGTWLLRWESAARDELCIADVDVDGDTREGCADPDCWYACAPECPPGTSCAL